MKAFADLTPNEEELLLKTPILICILIGGADGTIDKKEIRETVETSKRRMKKASPDLLDFYEFVVTDFEDKLKLMLQNYPKDAMARNKIIEGELAEINSILPKVSLNFAKDLYLSFKEVSMNIAKSSGGILGINSVGEEENKYVDLLMIIDPSNKQ